MFISYIHLLLSKRLWTLFPKFYSKVDTAYLSNSLLHYIENTAFFKHCKMYAFCKVSMQLPRIYFSLTLCHCSLNDFEYIFQWHWSWVLLFGKVPKKIHFYLDLHYDNFYHSEDLSIRFETDFFWLGFLFRSDSLCYCTDRCFSWRRRSWTCCIDWCHLTWIHRNLCFCSCRISWPSTRFNAGCSKRRPANAVSFGRLMIIVCCFVVFAVGVALFFLLFYCLGSLAYRWKVLSFSMFSLEIFWQKRWVFVIFMFCLSFSPWEVTRVWIFDG